MPLRIHPPESDRDREREYVINMLEIYAAALRGGQIDPLTVAAGLDEVRKNLADAKP